MNSSEELEIQLKIDKYLSDAMSESERLLFEEQMESDPILKEEVLLQKSVGAVLFEQEFSHVSNDDVKEEIDHVSEILQSPVYQEHEQHITSISKAYQKNQQKRKRWLFGSAAAILLLISSVLFYPSDPSYQDVYAQYADWTELTSYIEQNEENSFSKGEIFYKNKQYSEAIQFFKDYTSDSTQTLYASGLIYLGAAYFQNGEIENALNTFDLLISSDSYDRSKGYWYKLLIYLNQEDIDAMNQTLAFILKDPSNFNYQKAKAIKELF